MTELEKKLQAASQAYYTNGSSDLSDDEFDKLVEQVRTEQPDSELLKKIGWGYEVDKDTTPGEKCKHKYGKAGSLTKAYSWTELGDGFKNHKVDISAKLDGLSVVLYYEQGELVQALTRGDGITGIDITDKARYIIGTHIPDNEFTGAVRGEILMSHENFKKYKNTHPDAKNARNTSAGLINGKTITTDFMFLDIIPYSIVGMEWDTLMRLTANHSEVTMDVVRNWLHINFKKSISYTSMILNNTDELSGLFECWSEEYPIDGLVISEYYIRFIDAVPNQIAQAYKFKSEAAQVKVVNVEWNMSKNRLAIPRVQVEPVELVGTTVQYCTGYNAKYILDNNIGVGAIVEVEKHGEIIPNINKVVAISNKAELPAFCPYCNCELQWHGVHLECTNPNCENTTIKDTMIWTNIIAPIDNLGELLKEKFFVEWFGSVPTIEVLMRDKLPTYAFAYAVKGSQAHRMRCMLDSLYGDSEIKLVDAIKALNIPRFGDVNAAKLANCPSFIKELMDIATDGSCADGMRLKYLLEKLSNFMGAANAEAIENNMDKIARLGFIQNRIDWSEHTMIKQTKSKCKVAVTGKLSVKRSVFEQELDDAGYILGNITRDTKFLITDDPNSSSSKNKKADEWGITKITESQFRNEYM